jgi:hypothetical protein
MVQPDQIKPGQIGRDDVLCVGLHDGGQEVIDLVLYADVGRSAELFDPERIRASRMLNWQAK